MRSSRRRPAARFRRSRDELDHLSDLELVQLLAQEAQLLLEDHSGGDGGEDGEDRVLINRCKTVRHLCGANLAMVGRVTH